jgi:hypothetical protein
MLYPITIHVRPPINGDLNCIPDAYWAYYSAATPRFSELNGESVDGPGIWFTYCGSDGNYPEEDFGWENGNGNCEENKTADFAVNIAGANQGFWERYLLDDRRKTNKNCNNLSTIIHQNWCSTSCNPNEQQGCADLLVFILHTCYLYYLDVMIENQAQIRRRLRNSQISLNSTRLAGRNAA